MVPDRVGSGVLFVVLPEDGETIRRRDDHLLSLRRMRTPITIILNREFLSLVDCMKYSQLRRGLSPDDAAAYVGSKELLRQF